MNGIITIASGKGGSGKTTSALAIAGGLKIIGAQVSAVLDLDYGASLTRSYGYEPSEPFSERLLDGKISFEDSLHDTEEELMLIPASAGLSSVPKSRASAWRDKLVEFGQDHLIVIDTSDDIMSAPVIAAILASDILVIPTPLAKIDYDRTFPEIAGLLEASGHSPEIIWFATKVDKRPANARHILQSIAEDGIEIATMIPAGIAIAESQFQSMSVVGAYPKSKPALAYIELARSIYARLRRLRGAKPGASKTKSTKKLAGSVKG